MIHQAWEVFISSLSRYARPSIKTQKEHKLKCRQLAGSVGICALVLGVLDALRYEIPSFVSPVATIVSLSLTFVTIISGKESLLKPIQVVNDRSVFASRYY